MKKNKFIGNIVIVAAISLVVISIAYISKPFRAGEVSQLEHWQDEYPEIYESYMANANMSKTTYGGSVPIDYLEENPNLRTFYDGFGFSKEYGRARGHVYALDDAINTARPKGGASCLACKTADFDIAVDKEGIEVSKMDFDQFLDENPHTRNLNCYDCHRNQPGTIHITRNHFSKGLEHTDKHLDGSLSPNNQVCAQCHVEYYQEPENKEVVLPWHKGIETDDMLDYYEMIEFSDWEHPSTGAGLLKAQHPELETYLGSAHDKAGYTCTDCHMPEILGEDNLKSHHWTSPLKSEKGMEATCMTCHNGDAESITNWVEGIQEAVYIKTNEVSDELFEFIERLSQAFSDKAIEGEDLLTLQDIHRRAQFKWDFVFVENGEGFHNSQKAHNNLDEARELVREGINILEKYDY